MNELFAYILFITDWFVFSILSLSTIYLFIFSLFSLRKVKLQFIKTSKQSRIAVLFPAYREDEIILASIKSFFKQTYESHNFRVVVIADELQGDTISELESFDIDVLQVKYENSTKAKALNYAMTQLNTDDFDVVVILDVDNEVDSSFLVHINQAYQNGCMAVQAHRIAKNDNTSTAILDAISEEINNSIFRKGHVNAGLSSALIGSGIAFDIKWFKKYIKEVSSVGEDKELELLLHKQNIFIQYLEDVYVYDQKTESKRGFYKQRRRWQSAQFEILCSAFKQINKTYRSVGWDYWDKLFQWTMLPRSLTYGSIFFGVITTTLFFPILALKWWILFLLFSLAMLFAIPRKFYNVHILKAIPHIPILCVMMFLNLFHLRRRMESFIHTKHSKH